MGCQTLLEFLTNAPLAGELCTWQPLHMKESFHYKISRFMAQRRHFIDNKAENYQNSKYEGSESHPIALDNRYQSI